MSGSEMTDLEIEDVARQWIVYQQAWEREGGPGPTGSKLQWVYNLVDDMTHDRPEETWRFLLAVRRLDQSEMIEQILAAAVFEDLMSGFGGTLIDRVEAESRRDPSFLGMIRASYRLDMAEDVWTRLQALVAK